MPISMWVHSGYNKVWGITSKTMQHTLQCSKSTELRKGDWHPPGLHVSALASVQISLKDWLCKVQECVWPETPPETFRRWAILKRSGRISARGSLQPLHPGTGVLLSLPAGLRPPVFLQIPVNYGRCVETALFALDRVKLSLYWVRSRNASSNFC